MSVKHPSKPSADSSLPPALRAGPAAKAEPAGRSEFQRLLDEVESGFDDILVTGDPPPRSVPPQSDDDATETAENQFDQAQAQQLFRDLVVANAQPIRDFMIEVRLGEPHAEWLEHAGPSVGAIRRSAEGMGLGDLVGKVRRFSDALDKARALLAGSKVIKGEGREGLLDAYSDLIAFFPEAFAAEAESNRRESVIVHALLSKVPGLFPLALDRIHATGMASLGLFYVSRPREVAELAGVSLEVAERIVQRFAEYRRIASEISPANSRSAERARLGQAAADLAHATRAYEAAAAASPERRVHRRVRQLAMADVSILLARLGEIDRLRKIETMAYAARVDALLAYIEETQRHATAREKAK